MEFQFAQSKGQKMSRPAHFLDPYQFQIEEMVKLGCSDEHIHKVLHDIQKAEFTRDDLIRYMDETEIRKRRVVKGWTQEQVFEWEEYCENLRGNERIKGMLIVPGDKKKEK
nr:MAG TPA: protein of unknown function (DUF5338) [Caudoviricetes sp.]